jgi:hypothetical protein
MKSKQKKPFLSLTQPERDKVVTQFDQGVDFDQTRPLSPKGAALWKRAQRQVMSPVPNKNPKAVVIAVDGALLKKSDEYARRVGISRSELIARGLKALVG